MPDIAIRTEHLSKRYRIGAREQRHDTLAGAAAGLLRRPVDNLRRLRRLTRFRDAEADDVIWALKDVSLEVRVGEVVGVVGANGAGKSTLLKILSRITYPTAGTATLRGRVSSLLEVGTGFHPELTGRENVYLNGTILGMKKSEIDRKFDEIVQFSGVEKFIDTPLKRYSSGMGVRLAFAVAAHLEPEILLVDEVLAVGDSVFKKRCLGKMEEVSGQGRTVLFVSHDLAALNALCSRAVLLHQGALIESGETAAVVSSYLTRSEPETRQRWCLSSAEIPASEPIRLTGVALLDADRRPLGQLCTGDPLVLRMSYQVVGRKPLPGVAFVVTVRNHLDSPVLKFSNAPISGFPLENVGGRGAVTLELPFLPLTEGLYYLDVGLAHPGVHFWLRLPRLLQFHLEPRDVYLSGRALSSDQCQAVAPHRWIHEPEEGAATESGLVGSSLLEALPRAWK